MNQAKKMLAPLLAGGAAVWSAWNLVHAVQDGRVLRAVFEGMLTVVLLAVAWMMIETGKRFPDS
jgi:uncharacterized membrane protein SpoIIM required for sporulation